jgi:hypothetical protein
MRRGAVPSFSKSPCAGLHDSPYFETQSFLTWKCHVEQQDVSYFLCTEFSHFTFEGVAKQLWRRF